MAYSKRVRMLLALVLAALLALSVVASMLVCAPEAHAVPSWQDYQKKVRDHSDLRAQLAGVSKDLADQIIALDDLTENQIPQAQRALDDAQQRAQQTQSLADATKQRLAAAAKDKADLEQKIQQTGANYDDAREAVAQLARDSFHGSQTSQMMTVITKSSTTEDFVNKMQADAAVTRSEANAAADAASQLGVAVNRKDRLAAIEREIANLKQQADADAAQAAAAQATAQAQAAQLQSLRDQGAQRRAQLEGRKSGLTTAAAREAAEIVEMKSQIDSYNQQLAATRAAQANAAYGARQQLNAAQSRQQAAHRAPVGRAPQAPLVVTTPVLGNGAAQGMNYSVPGDCPAGAKFCYGHSTGNTVGGAAYPDRQCTLWAYIRRSQLGLPVGSYMGNGAEWANTGRRLGYLVNNIPHVGAAMVFHRGQRVGYWNADWQYGHVAVVERVNADGSVLISEGGTGFATFPAYETVYNASNYEYVHY